MQLSCSSLGNNNNWALTFTLGSLKRLKSFEHHIWKSSPKPSSWARFKSKSREEDKNQSEEYWTPCRWGRTISSTRSWSNLSFSLFHWVSWVDALITVIPLLSFLLTPSLGLPVWFHLGCSSQVWLLLSLPLFAEDTKPWNFLSPWMV